MRLFVSLMMICAGVLVGTQAASSPLGEFPFQFRDGLLWVEVQVPQSPRPLNFVLDSGAGVSAMNLSTAQRLGLKLGEEVKVRGVGSSTIGYWPQSLSARIGQFSLPQDYLVVDLSQLDHACEHEIDGLLGADFFQDKVVQIDFCQQKIRVLASSDVPMGAEVLPIKTVRQALRVPVQVNGQQAAWVRLDTGCASDLQWVLAGRPLAGVGHKISIGLAKLNIPLALTSVTLGKKTYDSVPTGLHEAPIFHGESGLLGNGLLARFEKVTIDTKAKRLILEDRPTLKEEGRMNPPVLSDITLPENCWDSDQNEKEQD